MIAQTGREAWNSLVRVGGIEVDGRDADLADSVRIALNPFAKSLDDAVNASTAEQVATAVLSEVSEFAAMMGDILHLLSSAGATEGKEQWLVALSENRLPVSLERFSDFIRAVKSSGGSVEIPRLRYYDAFDLLTPFMNKLGADDGTVVDWGAGEARSLWDRDYEDVKVPEVARPSLLHDVALAVLAKIRLAKLDGPGALGRYYDEQRNHEYRDPAVTSGLSLPAIAQNETDFWLATACGVLEAAGSLEPSLLDEAERSVAARFAEYPRDRECVSASFDDVEHILSLPAWGARHETYAVWIASQIVSSGRQAGHAFEAQEHGGRMPFEFGESYVGTFTTTAKLTALFAERKIPLQNPVGDSRTANCQPDFSLWDDGSPSLLVEVKHYKKSSPGKFGEVLTDYARCADGSPVCLAAHGPTTTALSKVPQALQPQCIVLDRFGPTNRDARRRFDQMIEGVLGSPVDRWFDARLDSDALVVVDTSPSFHAVLQSPEGMELVREACSQAGAADLLLGSDRPGTVLPAGAASIREALRGYTGGTDLQEVLRGTTNRWPIFVLTDAEGAQSLKVPHVLMENLAIRNVEVSVLRLEEPDT